MSDQENMATFRCRTPDESFKLQIPTGSNMGDLLKAISLRILKPQRQLLLSGGPRNEAIPVNDREATLEALGIAKGGRLVVSLKSDGLLLDVKSMFADILPSEGQSDEYKNAEAQFMQAHTRAMSFGHGATTGLGLGSSLIEPELEEKILKPKVKGIVTGSISDKVVLSNKFADRAQPGYVPGSGTASHSDTNYRSTDRRRSRSRSRDMSRRRRRSRSRSRSRDRKRRDGDRSRRQSHKDSHRSERETNSSSGNKKEDHLRSKLDLSVPKNLIAAQDKAALTVRNKLKKPSTEGTNGEGPDDATARAKSVMAERLKKSLQKVAAGDSDLTPENRVKAAFAKRLRLGTTSSSVESSSAGKKSKIGGVYEDVQSVYSQGQDRQAVLAAFEDDTQKDLSSVHDILFSQHKGSAERQFGGFAGLRSSSPANVSEAPFSVFSDTVDRDKEHFGAIFAPPSKNSVQSSLYDTQDMHVEEMKQPESKLSWRERVKAMRAKR